MNDHPPSRYGPRSTAANTFTFCWPLCTESWALPDSKIREKVKNHCILSQVEEIRFCWKPQAGCGNTVKAVNNCVTLPCISLCTYLTELTDKSYSRIGTSFYKLGFSGSFFHIMQSCTLFHKGAAEELLPDLHLQITLVTSNYGHEKQQSAWAPLQDRPQISFSTVPLPQLGKYKNVDACESPEFHKQVLLLNCFMFHSYTTSHMSGLGRSVFSIEGDNI